MAGLILAGDVGGTKTHLGLFRLNGGSVEAVREHVYPSSEFTSLEAACADFLGDAVSVDAACIGVPGPVIDGRAHASNLAWQLSGATLSHALNGVPVK